MSRANELLEQATPLPWGWRGHQDGSVELRSPVAMGTRVITTMRADPCIVEVGTDYYDSSLAITPGACSACKERYRKADFSDGPHCEKPDNLNTVWLNDREKGFVRPANDWAVREVPYRDDVVDVDHPDAALIVYAVNRLPDYEAAVEALDKFVSAFLACGPESIMPLGIMREVEDAVASLARLRSDVPA